MSRGTDLAAGALGTAAMAANAIPVAGQFASIGLGIASGFTKLFGNIQGPRKRRNRRNAEDLQRQQQRQRSMQNQQAQANMRGAGGQQMTGQIPPMPTTTLPATPPQAPVFGGSGLPPSNNDSGNYNG